MDEESDAGEGSIKHLDPPEREKRRDYLKTVGALVAGLAVGGAAGWLSKPMERVVEEVTKTVPGATVTKTITGPITPTPTPPKDFGGQEVIILAPGEEYFGKKVIDALRYIMGRIGIKIKWIPGDLVMRMEKCDLSIAAGSHDFDLVMCAPGPARYYEAGFLAPLDELIERDFGSVKDLREQFLPGSWSESIMDDGKVYMLPHYINWYALLYRKDLFEEYGFRSGDDIVDNPLTWDEYVEIAETLTLDLDGDGSIDIYGVNDAWDDDNGWIYFVERLHANGCEAFTHHPGKAKVGFDNECGIQALQQMKTLWDTGGVLPETITQGSGGGQARTFAAGLGATTINFAQSGGIASDPDVSSIIGKFDVGTIPKGIEQAGAFGFGEGFSITETCPYKDAAWEVLKYMSVDIDRAVVEHVDFNIIPSLKAVYEDPRVLETYEKVPWMKRTKDTILYGTQITPWGYQQPGKLVECYKTSIPIFHRGILGEISVEDAIHQAADACRKILGE